MSEGIVTNVDYRPLNKQGASGVVHTYAVEVVITAQMSNEEFDKLATALRSPTRFKVIVEERNP